MNPIRPKVLMVQSTNTTRYGILMRDRYGIVGVEHPSLSCGYGAGAGGMLSSKALFYSFLSMDRAMPQREKCKTLHIDSDPTYI